MYTIEHIVFNLKHFRLHFYINFMYFIILYLLKCHLKFYFKYDFKTMNYNIDFIFLILGFKHFLILIYVEILIEKIILTILNLIFLTL